MKSGSSSKKVVFITGASSGIGKAIATFLSSKNYIVYGTSRNPKQQSNLPYQLIPLNVSENQSIEDAVDFIVQKQGKIDILINNAGVGITGPIEETPEAEIKKAFDVNYNGPINVIKAVLPFMRKQKSGFIINITSIAGYMGLPYRGIYSATKGALEITSEALRMEVKDFNIKIVCVAPGDFSTNIAAGRFHSPVLEDSPYFHSYGKTLGLMNEHVDSGKDPQLMAKVIFEILQQKEPKIHYKVGDFMQKFSIVLKRLLPDKVYEKMLLKHYKL
ncbi:MAG TPA: SDR family oxidoreductase [Salinimicrobium sp.]|nr:SDR family oxidoreductase [Salinimicrobium sp.]